jgi:hypothetical protein
MAVSDPSRRSLRRSVSQLAWTNSFSPDKGDFSVNFALPGGRFGVLHCFGLFFHLPTPSIHHQNHLNKRIKNFRPVFYK